ncbi:Beta-1,3-xylanase TXYA [Thalassocella blandensis]|nr:Beta-1,3-xylanase TXYA [Thalassocella blandensis]
MRTKIRKQHRYLFCNITGLIDLTKATICLFAAFSFFCLAACSAHIHRSTINNGKFVPAENKILMFIGQDSDTVADYHKEVPEDKIEGVTLYTSLLSASPEKTLPAIHSPGNWGAGDTDFQKTLTQFPSASLAIGLSMAQCQHDHLFQIAQGHYDESLDVFIDFIQSIAPRPVFLRIGYEFDGPWNCYTPTPYKEAYRHIVKRFRARNIQNVAFVWQSGRTLV